MNDLMLLTEPEPASYVRLVARNAGVNRFATADDAIAFATLNEIAEYRIFAGDSMEELYAQVTVQVFASRSLGGDLQPAFYRAVSWDLPRT